MLTIREPRERLSFWRHYRLAFALSIPVLAALGAILYTQRPGVSRWFPSCPVWALSGLHCPGCGTLRGLHQLLHGNLAAAFGLNPMMVLCLPWMVAAFAGFAYRAVTKRRLFAFHLPSPWVWLIPITVVVFGIVRNLPFDAVAWMAP